MQILEASSLGLRSARIRLKRRGEGGSVTLFPMVHIGDADFYRLVYADAFSHDVVLSEGVDSPIVRHITRSYRWIKRSRMNNLIVQPQSPRQITCSAEIVASDLSPVEFEQAWRSVPLWLRAFVFFAAPIIGLRRRGLTREQIAKGFSLEDAPSQQELVDWSPEAGMLYRVILELRDERLIEHLDRQIDLGSGKSIAVVYGARHMRAVLRHLIGVRGFTCASADWLTVFDF